MLRVVTTWPRVEDSVSSGGGAAETVTCSDVGPVASATLISSVWLT